jgi:hypothetical protein
LAGLYVKLFLISTDKTEHAGLNACMGEPPNEMLKTATVKRLQKKEMPYGYTSYFF